MKIKYNNLYTHFIFTTQARQVVILEKNRVRIEKYEFFIKYYQETLRKY